MIFHYNSPLGDSIFHEHVLPQMIILLFSNQLILIRESSMQDLFGCHGFV